MISLHNVRQKDLNRTHTERHKHTHTYTHIHRHEDTHKHIYTQTHAHTYTHRHKHTHTHTHTRDTYKDLTQTLANYIRSYRSTHRIVRYDSVQTVEHNTGQAGLTITEEKRTAQDRT